MGVWQWVAQIALSLLLSYVLRPKPQTRPAPSLEEVEVPVAEEGKPIPVIFGRVHVQDANVVWYGNFKTDEIRQDAGK